MQAQTEQTQPKRGDFIAYLWDIKIINGIKVKEKAGLMLADKVDGKLRIGYSSVNTKKGDKFDKDFGLQIARGRMTKQRVLVKQYLLESVERFANRAKKYFRDAEPDFKIVTYGEAHG